MTREEWREVDGAVADSLELPPAERAAFLRTRLMDREDLLDEALSLVSYAGTDVEPIAAVPGDSWAGRSIGPYRLTEFAGEGGMGVVWAAERADGQFQRRVAVKFLSTLFPTTASVERFLLERDILARLDHPHIARLLDAGMIEPVHPYLVMEWVEGQRIDDYCLEHRLPAAEILRLFRQVLDAVAYAHQRLVVHRDLKPSNLLVTAERQVKLLDFGIAKMIDPGQPGGVTQVVRALTPEYASPEHLRGEPVTTATDVYSLGVVLYELLTGTRPFHLEGKTVGEVIAQAGHGIAEPPSAIRRELGGELDAIVLKAMRAEAAERYGSAAEMAADIDNYLAGRPVKARASGSLYVTAKFVRRHWLPLSGVALALVLITSSAIVATRQRIRAERRFEQLRQLAGAVIFEFQDNISRLPGTLEVRRQMVKRSLEYLDSLASDAGKDPGLLLELGRGYERLARVQGQPSIANLGDFAGALTSIRKSQAALQALLRIRPQDFDAACDLGDVLFIAGNIQERVPNEDYQATYREGIRHWEALASRYPDRPRALEGLAAAMYYKPDLDRALILYEQLGARDPANDKYQSDIALISRMLSSKADEKGDFDRERRMANRAAEIDRRRAGNRPLDREARLELSFDLSMLASWHENTKDLAGAIHEFEEVLAIREDLVRRDPRDEQAKDRLLYVLCSLGRLHGQMHHNRESARYYRRALDLGEELSRIQSRPNAQFAGLVKAAKEGLAAADGRPTHAP
jgi:serine/threonine protein kinase